MTWRPGLVALDVDGCLLEWVRGTDKSEEAIAPAVVDAVARVVRAGIPVVLASGRSPLGLVDVARLAGLPSPGWLVGSNGAVVARFAPLEVVRATTFDARPAVAAVLERFPDAMVAVEEPGLDYRVNRLFPRGELSGGSVVTSPAELGVRPACRVMIRHPEGSSDALASLADELGLSSTDYVAQLSSWLDISPVGVNKAAALAYVAGQLGVRRDDVLAIGDGHNDIEMLQWAGRGVAMGQAVQEVHDAADASTGTVVEDGVAVELERWF
ncbi:MULTISPECIES: HAD family hydrolase [unclassified Nocardioides]|uniref:HAD family hydrolase n=1 Tax=unclassified Nocardioides TaxID=2615069 RepID=UPI00070313D0|nr:MULTISPECIES: HAD family hydrolase [unclassified Nocardioides]KQZ75722.1 haloacid dehalogenase [Nocardioides sp. Root151]KRF14794.1 haloacid dehalogenase [Nocardioides sp. Soil796]